jgi:hypothetical protein
MLWLLVYWLLRRLLALLARGVDGERELESVVLRYQIKLLSRQKSRRLQLRTRDRAVLAAAALFLPRERRSCLLVGPDTLRRWHRQFVGRRPPRAHGKPGRPALARDRWPGGTPGAREPALGLHEDPRSGRAFSSSASARLRGSNARRTDAFAVPRPSAG